VAAALRNTLGELLLTGLKDPALAQLGMISVTGVTVSGDLGVATVYVVGPVDDPAAREALLGGLARATPYLRAEAASRLNLRRAPELRFRVDESIPHGQRIESILEELATEERK
jgi:ribosome-binding factor A